MLADSFLRNVYGQNVLSSFCDSIDSIAVMAALILLHGCALDPQLSHGLLLLGICLKSPLSKSLGYYYLVKSPLDWDLFKIAAVKIADENT